MTDPVIAPGSLAGAPVSNNAPAAVTPNQITPTTPGNPNQDPTVKSNEPGPQTGRPGNPTVARSGVQPHRASPVSNPAPVLDPDAVEAKPAEVKEDELPESTRAEMDAGRKALGRNAPGAHRSHASADTEKPSRKDV
jgi:hypothetical protein